MALKISRKQKAALASYGRSLAAMLVLAYVVVADDKAPWELTSGQWTEIANALWASLIPVFMRWINPNDKAYGRGVSE